MLNRGDPQVQRLGRNYVDVRAAPSETDWGADVDSVTGWRWDTMILLRANSWSAPATCRWPEWKHPGRDAPVPGCTCGYRVCKDVEDAWQYLFPARCPRDRSRLLGQRPRALIRVTTRGALAYNEHSMGPRNCLCLCAAQIKPAWPDFVVDEKPRRDAARVLPNRRGVLRR